MVHGTDQVGSGRGATVEYAWFTIMTRRAVIHGLPLGHTGSAGGFAPYGATLHKYVHIRTCSEVALNMKA